MLRNTIGVCLQGLRDHGESIVLMGKNTMMKRSIRLYCEKTGNDQWPGVIDSLVGNVGLIFTKGDLNEVRCAPSAARLLSLSPLNMCTHA